MYDVYPDYKWPSEKKGLVKLGFRDGIVQTLQSEVARNCFSSPCNLDMKHVRYFLREMELVKHYLLNYVVPRLLSLSPLTSSILFFVAMST